MLRMLNRVLLRSGRVRSGETMPTQRPSLGASLISLVRCAQSVVMLLWFRFDQML